MKNLIIMICSFLVISCSASNSVHVTASPEGKSLKVSFTSDKPIQDMNQGTTEKPILTGFLFRPISESGERTGDDVFLGFNSSDYLKEIRKSKSGEVSIEYDEIYFNLQERHFENPELMNEIHRVEIFWKPFFSKAYKIPVECLKENNQLKCVKP